MKGSKLIEIMDSLTKKDIREINKYLLSPFFNQREDVIWLFNHLTTAENVPSKAEIQALIPTQLHPKNRAIDGLFVRQLMSFLVDCLEQYLIVQQVIDTSATQKFYLAKAYQARSLGKLHEQTINEIAEFQHKTPFRNHEYYYNQYLLLEGQQRILAAQKSRADTYLEAISFNLDIAYISEKLHQACNMMNFQRLYGSEYNVALIGEIEGFLAAHPDVLALPAVAIYYYSYLAIKDPNNDHNFNILRQLFTEHSEKFAASEILDLYIITLNHHVRKSNEGMGDPNIVFEMYRLGIEKRIVFNNKILPHSTFFNVVRSALQADEIAWARTFVNENKPYLERKYQDNMAALCLANIEYQSNGLGNVITLLNPVNFKEPLFNLIAKTLIIKVFYELNEYNVLDNQILNMKKYIQTKRVLGYHKTNYLNIALYMRKLLNLNFHDRQSIEKLRQEIIAEQTLTERKWFLKQLNQF